MGISPSADGDNGLPPLDPDKPFEKGLTENFSVLVRQLWWGIEQLRRLARKRKLLNSYCARKRAQAKERCATTRGGSLLQSLPS